MLEPRPQPASSTICLALRSAAGMRQCAPRFPFPSMQATYTAGCNRTGCGSSSILPIDPHWPQHAGRRRCAATCWRSEAGQGASLPVHQPMSRDPSKATPSCCCAQPHVCQFSTHPVALPPPPRCCVGPTEQGGGGRAAGGQGPLPPTGAQASLIAGEGQPGAVPSHVS